MSEMYCGIFNLLHLISFVSKVCMFDYRKTLWHISICLHISASLTFVEP